MYSAFNKKLFFCSILLFAFMLGNSAFAAPAKGMRYKTLPDVLDEIMQTKDLEWLKQNLGEPAEQDNQYPKYTILRWKAQKEKTDCKQAFAISKENKIMGWSTNCPVSTGNKAYGEISANTPIPKSVIPEEIAQVMKQRKEQIEAEANAKLTRQGTYADWLHSYIGKSEEEVYVQHKDLSSSETLHSGKVVKTYFVQYSKVHGFDTVGYTCKYSLSFVEGTVVGYDAGNCGDESLVRKYDVPYNTPPAKWSAL